MNTKLTFLKKSALLAALLSAVAVPASAHRYDWYDGRWAHEKSDVKPDPSVVFGRLENGLRWAVLPNANPANRLSLRLNVQTGSMMEEPHEWGIAHYLEHMAFNGSENFPAGELIPFFQKHGMSFGGDTNAHTTWGETVYKLNLSQTSEAAVTEGLLVLRDMADRLTIEDKEVDEERGIIFSEKRARESEQVLAGRQWRDFLYKGTKYENDTIGTDETINAINAKMIRAYYEKWYVPARMTVIFSGTIKPEVAEKMVKNLFGSMEKKALPAIDPLGTPDMTGTKILVQKRPISSTAVTINIMTPELPVLDDEARQRLYITQTLAQVAVQRRLVERAEDDPTLWTRGFFRDGRLATNGPAITFAATTSKDHWQKAIKVLQEELLRAKQFGLTEGEFAQIKKQVEMSLKRSVKQRSAWTNEDFADAFVDVQNSGMVFTSAEQDLERYYQIIETLSLKEVNDRLAAGLSFENRRIQVSGNADTTEADVKAYWDSLQNLKVEAPTDAAKLEFPYLRLPEAGPELKLTEVKVPAKDLDMVTYQTTLANGTKVVFQPLTFEKGTVSATYIFGDGLMALSDNATKQARFTYGVLKKNAVGKLSPVELSRLYGGRGLQVSEGATEFANTISGSAQSEDVELLLQALWHQFKDPTVTDKNRQQSLRLLKENEYKRKHAVEGVVKAERNSFFTGEPMRTRPVEYDEARRLPMKWMNFYVNDIRTRGPRTLVVSGDFDMKKAAAVVSQLFGALPESDGVRRRVGPAPAFPAGQHKVMTVAGDKLGKAVVMMAWHKDHENIHDRKTIAARVLAASVIRERMRLILREKLAAAYSPFAFYRNQAEHAGYGYLLMQVETKIPRLDEVKNAMEAIVADLLREGVTAQELARLKKPVQTQWATQRKTNKLWQNLMLNDLMLENPYLDWYEVLNDYYTELTPEDIERELKAMFEGERASLIVKSEE